MFQDLRYAIRALRSSPGFAVVAILSLALGIGANTAIFSLIDSVMLRTLPVSHPEQLVQLTTAVYRDAYTNLLWEQIRDRQDVFSGRVCLWLEPLHALDRRRGASYSGEPRQRAIL